MVLHNITTSTIAALGMAADEKLVNRQASLKKKENVNHRLSSLYSNISHMGYNFYSFKT